LARELVFTPMALFSLLVLLPPTRRGVMEFTGVKEGNEDEHIYIELSAEESS
jgi:hypothetical protein